MPRINLSPRAYGVGLARDFFGALRRVARDRAALAAIILLLLPWFALVFIRAEPGWVESLGGMTLIVALFWFTSRSGAAPAPIVKRPRLEFLLALVLVILWVEYRAAMCGKFLPFLPPNFACYNNLELEVLPKLMVHVVVPVATLLVVGYGLRAQGLHWSWRAWWVALLPIGVYVALRFVMHPRDIAQFAEASRDNLVFHFFGAGLPEEVLFRAFLLTRLEAMTKNSGWALFAGSLIFGLAHLPIDYLVFTNRDWRETWLLLLTFQTGYGATFAFAYQRIRNVYPIAVLHALVNVV